MTSNPASGFRAFGILLLSLLVVLGALFHLSFEAPYVLFASDGPLGHLYSQWEWVSNTFSGFWQDLNWIGIEQPSAAPTLTMGFFVLLGPVNFLKFYPPLTLVFLGVCAWFFFRRLNLSPTACVLAALATALNTHPFSYACWGLGTLPLAFGFSFLAMGLMIRPERKLLHAALAGFCLGMAVMEGFDNGAILSVYTSIWVVFLWWQRGDQKARQTGQGVGLIALMAVCAALISAQTLHTLITTQIQGVSGTQQDAQTKEQRWDWATQWSLPKAETLRVIIPGLFGYRMDTEQGGQYWGATGQTPGVPHSRHSGSGEYAGVLVVLAAGFALACAAAKSKLLSPWEIRIIWFWAAIALVSLLFSWGRHAPFYRWIYSLPYVSTIRNPIKFLLPFQMGLLVLFAYGLQCIFRKCEQNLTAKAASLRARLGEWWSKGPKFEVRYGIALGFVFAATLLGYLVYASSRTEMIKYLGTAGFPEAQAVEIHEFSLAEIRWTMLFMACGIAAILLALAGAFSEAARFKWLPIVFGLILGIDLYRANVPWVIHYNYKEKYEENALFSLLKERPFERRVTARFHPIAGNYIVGPQARILPQFYNEWLQHQFQYYRIQSLDISQMPRIPELDQNVFSKFTPKSEADLALSGRLWQLTNTRLILAQKEFLQLLNQYADPRQHRFQILKEFNFGLKPGRQQAVTGDDLQPQWTTNGPFAVIEFTGALPRAKLYNAWKTSGDDPAILNELASPEFDPENRVFVSAPGPADPATNALSSASNKVEIVSYQPRRWELRAESPDAGILLLNDRYDSDWKVSVDGKPEPLLRCNYMMRGVYLPKGAHQVVFEYAIPPGGLYFSFAGIAAALLLAGFLGFSAVRRVQAMRS